MVFVPPSWVPPMPGDPPDSISIWDFMNDEKYGRYRVDQSRNPYTCGLTGQSFTAEEVRQRTSSLAKAISKRLQFSPNEGTPWDKVVAIYCFNTIDYIPLTHAVHRLSGIVSPASAAYSSTELQHQIETSGAKALFTCVSLLENALKAAAAAKIPTDKVFILELPEVDNKAGFVTVSDLIREGEPLPDLDALGWTKGQGARQVAYLCYSSGTSGLPKAVMISHFNVIANVLQYATHEKKPRQDNNVTTQVAMGLLPMSHIYALVVVTHGSVYRGDEVVVLPRFELGSFLASIQRFGVQHMCLVPPVVIALLRNQPLCRKFDLSSVRFVYTGAAPLGGETVRDLLAVYPSWHVGQGYGMTETSTVVCSTSESDICIGTSGSLVPGARAKIMGFDGKEITEYEEPGELLIQSPSVVLGYLNNERANAETFVWDDDGRWIRTGDEALVRVAPSGNEHLVIVDRIKELIKVKGHQVAPAELEAHLLTHPNVSDCAVIQVPDDHAGEVPKAFVVKTAAAAAARSQVDDEAVLARSIAKHVEDHKARYKWLKGGIQFVDAIPKSASGKILRRLLRDREKEARKTGRQAKL